MQIIQVVRRYGPVGGMERYVWELTQKLRDLGHDVVVVCQVCLAEKPHGITIFELGVIAMRPRWLSSLRFSRRVAHWLMKNPHPESVIHSHERLNCHHISTFHGSPFATVYEKPWWRLVSLRVWMQLFLERRELSTAQYIVPNSYITKQQLTHYYPKLAYKLTEPIVPGVGNITRHKHRSVPTDGGVIGFVGQEWKRKGLALAVEAVAQLRLVRPNLQFHVIGSKSTEIEHLFKDWQGGYHLFGWSSIDHYADFDVLLHPAKAEPYGMVISEAMAAGLPVVISDVCGVAPQVAQNSGAVLPLTAPVKSWSDAIDQQLSRNESVPKFERSWNQVAQEFVEIYSKYVARKINNV